MTLSEVGGALYVGGSDPARWVNIKNNIFGEVERLRVQRYIV